MEKKDFDLFYVMDNRLYEKETNVSVYTHKLYYLLRTIERAFVRDVMVNLDFLCVLANFVDSHSTKNKARVFKCLEELMEKGFVDSLIGDYEKQDNIFIIKLVPLDNKEHTQITPNIIRRIEGITDEDIKKYDISPKDKLIMFKFVCFIIKWMEAHTFRPSVDDFCKCLDITERKFYNIRDTMIELELIEKEHGGWFEDSETPKRKPNKYKYTDENAAKYRLHENDVKE